MTQVGGADISAELMGLAQICIGTVKLNINRDVSSKYSRCRAHYRGLGALVDCIVTEPFLGKQNPKEEDIPGMFKGLEKMYWAR